MELWELKVVQYCVNKNYISIQELKEIVLELKETGNVRTLLSMLMEHFNWKEDEAQYIFDNAKKISYGELAEKILSLDKDNKFTLEQKELKQIARYQIVEIIGEGGMGKVFLAYDPLLDRKIALKLLTLGPAANHIQIERFIREAKATAKLKHPNIITIYDIGIDKQQRYITMEYIKGETLAQVLKSGRLSLEELLHIFKKVVEAVNYANSCNIIHRDLKPENILLDERKEPYVMDFGLAKLLGNEENFGLTQEGMIIGSLYYMSPEQAQGANDNIDNKTDIYSLGVILYEILTGRLPFKESNVVRLIMKIAQGRAKSPGEINPDIPEELEKICLKAIKKDKLLRHNSAGELAKDLEAFLTTEKKVSDIQYLMQKAVKETSEKKVSVSDENFLSNSNVDEKTQELETGGIESLYGPTMSKIPTKVIKFQGEKAIYKNQKKATRSSKFFVKSGTDTVYLKFSENDTDFLEKIKNNMAQKKFELPVLPDIAIKINKLVSSPKTTITDLENVVATDQSIAAQVLKKANTVLYCGKNKVTSLKTAVTRLGMKKLRSTVFAIVMKATILRGREVDDIAKKLWLHSISTALLSEFFEKRVIKKSKYDELFTAALLHDIHKVIILTSCRDVAKQMQNYFPSKSILDYIYKECFELVFWKFAKHWQLPEHIIEIIPNINDFNKSKQPTMTALISIANIVTKFFDNQLSSLIPILPEMEFLNITKQQMEEELLEEVKELYQKIQESW